MTRKKKNIQITVSLPKAEEAEAFQRRVNEIYCEIVHEHLRNLETGAETKKKIVDELIKKWSM